LRRLAQAHGPFERIAGVDASLEAVAMGKAADGRLDLRQGLLHQSIFEESFDCLIVNFVLHWVDRASLAASIAEIDRLILDGGFLILGDFAPDHNNRCAYHHLPAGQAFTYKQEYAEIFLSLGIYSEVCRVHYNHDQATHPLLPVHGGNRASCVLLQKSLNGFYPELSE
jgi:SAM-dependent methyltransferase